MRECLRKTDRHSLKSVAFLPLGTSKELGYPRELVARLMYAAVVEFDQGYTKTSLKEVTFVINRKDADLIKVGF